MTDIATLEHTRQEPSLHAIYVDLVTWLDEFLRGNSEIFIEDPRLTTTSSIVTSCFELKIWATDIREPESKSLDLIETSAPDLARKVRIRLLGIKYAIDTFEIELDSIVQGDNRRDKLKESSIRVLVTVRFLAKLTGEIIERMEGQNETGLGSNVRLALQQRLKPPDKNSVAAEQLAVAESKDFDYSDEEPGFRRRRQASTRKPDYSGRLEEMPRIIRSKSPPLSIAPIRSKSSSSTTFRFNPISKNQARLATLYPGSFEEQIECSINIFGLNELEALEYEAISYAWSSWDEDRESVRIVHPHINDDKDTAETLWLLPHAIQALRCVRNPEKPLIIWIDVLCVDLASDEEKLFQSSNYATLFRQARKVYLWIGDKYQKSRETFDWIEKLVTFALPEDLDLDHSSASEWEDLLEFMQLDLFRRRWVVQEIILAQEVVILAENSLRIPWSDLTEAAIHWQRAKSRNKSLAAQLYKNVLKTRGALTLDSQQTFAERLIFIDQYFALKRTQNIAEELRIDEIVILFSWTTSSIAKDAIYAFLSLARGKTKDSMFKWRRSASTAPLLVQYDLSDRTVFMRFVAYCIQVSGSLDMICRPWAPKDARNLPTWIGKIQDESHFSPRMNLVGNPGQERQPYNASAASCPSYRFSDEVDLKPIPKKLHAMMQQLQASSAELDGGLGQISDSQFLFVESIRYGAISKMSARISQGIITRECLELGGLDFSGYKGKWTADAIPDKLWRTLVADQTTEGKSPPPWYPRAIAASLNNNVEGELVTRVSIHDADHPTALMEVLSRIQEVTWNKKLLRTSDNQLVLAPAQAAIGDEVYILLGCSVPVLLRRIASISSSITGGRFARIISLEPGSSKAFELIGECFVLGLMNGEALEDWDPSELSTEERYIMLV